MKLIIQIPCHNEEHTLPLVLKDLPKKIEGIDRIEIIVINDGSTDATVTVARSLGVTHIVSLSRQRGLAFAFRTGIAKALEEGADIIVNTDGDNQYQGKEIVDLVTPIIHGGAQVVIGCRNMAEIKHFSFSKKLLQRIGSNFVGKFSKTTIPDVTSGFRAFSRDAAMRVNIFSDYTYTLETLIQAGRNNLTIAWIPIHTNAKLRESRLIKSTWGYIVRSVATVLRLYLMYEPLRSFFIIGLIPILAGSTLIGRFLYAHFTRPKGGHIQSLIIAAIIIIMGFGIMMIGLLGDIISANRKLNEEVLYRLKKSQQ